MRTRDKSLSGNVSMESIRVLCVDDEPDRPHAAAEFLEQADIAIETQRATGASDALECLAETDIDCIVSEYDLPDRDGLALLEAVQADYDDVPFILYTDAGSEAVASEAISAGVSEYVRKGADGDESTTLTDRVVDVVATTRARLERRRQLSAIETAQEGIGILDANGRFVYVNQAYADLYGYDPAEMIGEGWERLYPEGDVATVRDEIIPTVMAEGDWHGETTGLRADGSTFVEAHSLSTTGNGDLICTVQDISGQKERERDLERYETIVEALGDPVYTVDSDGRYAYVNDAYAELTGYEKDEIIGQHISFLIDEASVERGTDGVRSLLSSETETRQQTHETIVKTEDGEQIQCEANISLLPLADGQYRGVAGVVRDITERKERERELEEYETILETIPDEVYTLDAEGYLTKIVPPIDTDLTMTGHEPAALVGEHVSTVMDDDDIATAESVIRDLLCSDDRKRASFEMETIANDGGRTPHENHIAILPSDDGQFRGTVGVLRDITERKKRERELKAQNERLDRFASIVSHDLRNPLNVAQGRLEIAREEYDSEDLEVVAWAHDRMAVLIENLLAVAREPTPDPDTAPVDLATVAENCWRHVETTEATLRLETDAIVRADRTRFKQLLENLIRNAVEHSSASPASHTQQDGPDHDGRGVTVTIGELDDERGHGFYVEDDGPGIPADERDRVFESGYSSANNGTGLGLAIVAEVAKAHGWTVAVTDGADGGARFEFTGVDRADRGRAGGGE
ncbi:PAS domain S-box protein [Natrinema sp. 74]|uniref:PAS domain S-box protein n=1 Tax=Natrinema sp. 74 TaxID=3384159 RepID=UPI0038D4FFAC